MVSDDRQALRYDEIFRPSHQQLQNAFWRLLKSPLFPLMLRNTMTLGTLLCLSCPLKIFDLHTFNVWAAHLLAFRMTCCRAHATVFKNAHAKCTATEDHKILDQSILEDSTDTCNKGAAAFHGGVDDPTLLLLWNCILKYIRSFELARKRLLVCVLRQRGPGAATDGGSSCCGRYCRGGLV